ncbi:hypothetical protein VCUG_00766 [Vavraia culicis subsp. floridensis]|uniref:Uncharacterized protein n=1 Tax=Vavraia culicis (isolate floridensis) TaxID=948595 RepID=L2GVM0_VAVCU|nr:uncharacterized protein VCUG_00766 [Vavraia culicis subsp. floridensis]ELA47684.1 hypothetical protein VCUG_00766 [Vavraia culicis subsp. floridensis]
MRRISSFTATELLYLAHKTRKNIYTPSLYEMLQRRASENNYTSCVAYAEDTRFKRLIELYKKKKILQEQCFNRSMIPIGKVRIDPVNTDKNIVSTLYTYRYTQEVSTNRPLGTMMHSSNLFSLHVQPSVQAQTPIAIPLDQNKHHKRYYLAMTEEEKELDDFLDKLEERNYGKSRCKNLVKDNFPILNKEKVTDAFSFIVDKVTTRKGIKDKNLWPSEYQIVLKKIKDELGLELSVGEDMQLVQAVLKVLMMLQKWIFDKKEIVKAIYFKKLVIAFYDFYRK